MSGACTIDNHGLLAANVTEATGAVVVDIYAVGGVLRTNAFDAGGSLGYSHRSYVYPATASGLPEAGWHWLGVALPATRPVAFTSRIVGLDAGKIASEVGGSVGYQSVTVMASVPENESVAYSLDYRPDDPAATILSNCEGMPGC